MALSPTTPLIAVLKVSREMEPVSRAEVKDLVAVSIFAPWIPAMATAIPAIAAIAMTAHPIGLEAISVFMAAAVPRVAPVNVFVTTTCPVSSPIMLPMPPAVLAKNDPKTRATLLVIIPSSAIALITAKIGPTASTIGLIACSRSLVPLRKKLIVSKKALTCPESEKTSAISVNILRVSPKVADASTKLLRRLSNA